MPFKIKEPYYVDELVVYFINEEEALVTDYDCRWELLASADSCECCTFQFRYHREPGFVCRHINAVRRIKNKS